MCNAFVLSTELCKVSIKSYIKGDVRQPKQLGGGWNVRPLRKRHRARDSVFIPLCRWDRLTAQSASGCHGGGARTPEVREAGSAPLRTSARSLLWNPQEKHSEIQQFHFAHRLTDSFRKAASVWPCALEFAPCGSTALWRNKFKVCIFMCIFSVHVTYWMSVQISRIM